MWMVGARAQPGLAIHSASSMRQPGGVRGWGLGSGGSGTGNMIPAVQGLCTGGSRSVNRSG